MQEILILYFIYFTCWTDSNLSMQSPHTPGPHHSWEQPERMEEKIQKRTGYHWNTVVMYAFIWFLISVLWSRDILIPYGSGSAPLSYGSGSCSFCQWLSRCQQKISFFFKKFFSFYFLKVQYIYIILQRQSHKEVTKP